MVAIAHVGYGYWGKNLARNWSELGVLRAIVDPHPPAAEAASKLLGIPAMGFEAAIGDPHIDAVSLATPAQLHFAQASAALRAGKHVYVEKPVALDLSQAETLCELARSAGRKLMVGHLLQYHPAYVRLREMVRAGALGRLQYVYSNRMSLGKFRTEENVLWSFAPHDISMILGLVESEPTHVTAQGTVAYTSGVADFVTMQMHFADGASGHVQVSWMHPFKEQRLVVIGDQAMAVFDDSDPSWDNKLKLYRHTIDRTGAVPNPVKAEPELIVVPKREPLRDECAHFIECIEQDLEPRTNGAEGLRVLRVLQAAETTLSENLALQQNGRR